MFFIDILFWIFGVVFLTSLILGVVTLVCWLIAPRATEAFFELIDTTITNKIEGGF